MQYIDEKFKEVAPVETVKRIKQILSSIDVKVDETWFDSGLSNCFSLNLFANGGSPFSNGKGITKEFAQASAYGEFIERLQGGLFFYKNQSIIRDKSLDMHSYAPDVRYMTVEELIENGEWMDYLMEVLDNPRVTRKTIAEQCKVYACSNDGKILTLPFYSLFEDKYVYLPMGFVDQIYGTNGCCVGNTREEAWVHAFSELLERHAMLRSFSSGEAAPRIPEEVLQKFPVVSNILAEIRSTGNYDIEVFDLSLGNGYPVVSTRVISKKTHSYLVNVASDPVFEIALHRTFTEMFQGRSINNMHFSHNGTILPKIKDNLQINNILNQLETGNGLYSADYFANEITCTKEPSDFDDNSDKTNPELLRYSIDKFKKIGKPVYIRNFSFLGFPCYRFVIPGFSEALIQKVNEVVPQYAFADEAAKIGKDIAKASDDDLNMFLYFNNMIKNVYSRYNVYGRIVGLPLTGKVNVTLGNITRAYASYRLGRYEDAIKYINSLLRFDIDSEVKGYFTCVNKYIELLANGISQEKIRVILKKFFEDIYADKLFKKLDNGLTPFDGYLLSCDLSNCEKCRHKEFCAYNGAKQMYVNAGKIYSDFIDGQNKSNFLC